MQRLIREQNRKLEDKIKDLQNFIARFSANKSKSRQATSRRKLLDKLAVEEMPASSRRYPFVGFNMDREPGKEILEVENLTKSIDGVKVLDHVSFRINRGDKVGFVGENEIAVTTLFRILMEEIEPDEGTFKWGISTSRSYFPKDNSNYFDGFRNRKNGNRHTDSPAGKVAAGCPMLGRLVCCTFILAGCLAWCVRPPGREAETNESCVGIDSGQKIRGCPCDDCGDESG